MSHTVEQIRRSTRTRKAGQILGHDLYTHTLPDVAGKVILIWTEDWWEAFENGAEAKKEILWFDRLEYRKNEVPMAR